MDTVFLKILNMSISVSWLIMAIIPLRLILKKAPKWAPCLLWALVAIRLVCPFSFESLFSLIPSAETISPDILYASEPMIESGIPALNQAVNPVISEAFSPADTYSANPLQIWTFIGGRVWLLGVVSMLVYAVVSFLRLRRRVGASLKVSGNIRICDDIDSPFILGIFKPGIYLPSDLDEEQFVCVLAHENAHLKRCDHLWKPLGFALLSVYWFNPLCWLAYVLLCRDIELACDEKVIRDMDKEDLISYSRALLDCSIPRRQLAACPLAFGEVGVKSRIRSVLNYKKPGFWIIIIAVLVCIAAALCFLTDPKADSSPYDWTSTLTEDDISYASYSMGGDSVITQMTELEQFFLVHALNTVEEDEIYTGRGVPGGLTVSIICGEAEYTLRWGGDTVELDMDSKTAKRYGKGIWEIHSEELLSLMDEFGGKRQLSDADPTGISVSSGGESITPYMIEVESDSSAGLSDSSGVYKNAPLLLENSDRIPAIKLADDINIRLDSDYPLRTRLTVYDLELNQLGEYDGEADLTWLESGEYYCVRGVYTSGKHADFIFRLIVGDSVTRPFVPGAVQDLVSASLEIDGLTCTISDERGLRWLENALNSAEESYPSDCGFGWLMVLECASGESFTCSPATDSCSALYADSKYYSYKNAGSNEELMSLFYPAYIHEKGTQSFELGLLRYMDWTRYSIMYGGSETVDFIMEYKAWVLDDVENRAEGAMYCMRGLDAAPAEAYAGLLYDAYLLDKADFAWYCIGNAPEDVQREVINALAYVQGVTPEETRAQLEADIE